MKWFRMYSETFSDLKLRKVARQVDLPLVSVIGIWLALLALASESPERGKLLISAGLPLTLDDIAEYACCNVSETLQHFIGIGIVTQDAAGVYAIPSWDKRQYTSDDSSERVRASRERKKQPTQTKNVKSNNLETLQGSYGNDPREQSTDTDPEEEEYAPAPRPSSSSSSSLAPAPTPTPAPNPDQDAAYAAVVAMYEQNIGLVTGITSDQIKAAIEQHPVDWIRLGLELAVKNEKRSWGYVEGCLRNWKTEGFGNDRQRASAVGFKGATTEEREKLKGALKRAKQGIATAENLGFEPQPHDLATIEKAKKAGLL